MGLPNPWHQPVISVGEAAEVLAVSRSTAYRMASRGTLPTVKGPAAGPLLVPVAELLELMGLPLPPRPGPVPRVITGRG